ncbi:MAG: type II toxin-antitoxin system prevent-host-death family antitoxin [Pseudomonadota bacterium]|nr:type II toxin-antitoxin system prevent-host-death family antitoxin [Pseudomonadota bacterium]
MLEINVKEARDRFRELLDLAEAGEDVVILRRGHPVARLIPVEKPVKHLPSLETFREGIGPSGSPSSDLLREDRDAR